MDYDKDFEDGYENTSLGAIHFKHHPGAGEKIIFLHGMGSNTKAWSKLVSYLPNDLDVFLIDLLGHGESDAPDIVYSISNQFQALREFVAMQNNGNSFLFGHSYGAWIAAFYASQSASKGIILEDAAGQKEFFDEIMGSGKAEEYKEKLLNLAMMTNNNKEFVIKNIIDTDFKEDQLDSELLSSITAKTLILWGSEDRVLDKIYADLLSSKIKDSTLKLIEGAGHEAHFSHPKEVSDLLVAFIRESRN